MMIYYISNYLLIGVLFGLLATLMNQYLSLKDESVKQFNAGESILLITLWPFYLSIYFYHLFKK